MPTGPDIYFDNVGGRLGQTVMSLMRRPARVIECGQISTYNDDGGGWLVDVRPIHQLGLRFEGFNSMLFADFHPGAAAQVEHWIRTGAVIPCRQSITGSQPSFPPSSTCCKAATSERRSSTWPGRKRIA
jgi:NADPH-dependent curcumin reductase CurA